MLDTNPIIGGIKLVTVPLNFIIYEQVKSDYIYLKILDVESVEGEIKFRINIKKQQLEKEFDKIIGYYRKITKNEKSLDFNEIRNRNQNKIASIGSYVYKAIIHNRKHQVIDKLLNWDANNPGQVLILSENFYVPYEFLTKNKRFYKPKIFGSKFLIYRKYQRENRNKVQSRYFLDNNSLFKVLYYSNKFLNGAQKYEVGTFNKLENKKKISCISIDNIESDKKEELEKKIANNNYDILHLACHIKHKENYLESCLDFGDEEINYESYRNYPHFKIGKLVFLNACRSGQNDRHIKNFTEATLDNGASVVISVDCDVPDELAGKIAMRFYKNLIEENLPIGSALNKSIKSELNYNNIGGLFYSLYL